MLRYFRKGTDAYENAVYGFSDNPFEREALSGILGTEVGLAIRKCDNMEDIVLSSLWAWERMPRHLFRWAWVSRGLVSLEDMAKMNGLSLDEVKKDETLLYD